MVRFPLGWIWKIQGMTLVNHHSELSKINLFSIIEGNNIFIFVIFQGLLSLRMKKYLLTKATYQRLVVLPLKPIYIESRDCQINSCISMTTYFLVNQYGRMTFFLVAQLAKRYILNTRYQIALLVVLCLG